MCGIVGYVGKRSAQDVLLDGLEKLEYRGYDSAGVALALDGGIRVVKAKGRLTALRERLAAQQLAQSFCGIGHTRWATHGEPSDVISHPHSTPRVSIVHNGIIENYGLLKDFYRGVVLTDDLMHQPVNKEWMFSMYMSAEFPSQKLMLLEQCHYYKGERLCPFHPHGKAMLFAYERCWVKFNLFPQEHPHIEEDLDYYKQCGLADLCPDDGVPMSMKALLLNRWLYWGGDFANLDIFREWYRALDYTNVNGGLRKEDLYEISNPDFLFFWGHHGKPGETT